MLPSFVLPEIVLDVAMFMVVTCVLKFIPLGTCELRDRVR
jgi:hypothetical protein